jgi:hypothetical protein
MDLSQTSKLSLGGGAVEEGLHVGPFARLMASVTLSDALRLGGMSAGYNSM